jgi:hypothetical protein
MTTADEKVERWILQDFRDDLYMNLATPSEKHLAKCESAQAKHVEGKDGTYGCTTGCPYATLEAVIECEHGYREEYKYGEFGDLPDLIRAIENEVV